MPSIRRLSAVVFASLAAAAAYAQDARPEPPLKGPAVKDNGIPGENRRFSGGGSGKDRYQRPVPHRAFMAAFGVLRGEKADAAIRLSQAQDDQLRALDRAHQEAIEAYKAEHAPEIRDLVASLPQEDRRRVGEFLGGRRPGALIKPGDKKAPAADAPAKDAMQDSMSDADPKKVEDARARLREIMEGAPQVGDIHAKMFAVLTEAQRPVFQAELDRLKKEITDRREPGKVDKQIDKRNPDAPPATDQPLSLDDPRIPEQVRERIKALPPDEQRAAIRRLMERLRNAQPK